MSIEADLLTFLSADPGVSALTSNIFIKSNVEGITGQYVSFSRTDTEREHDMSGAVVFERHSIEVAASSSPSATGANGSALLALALADAVEAALDGHIGAMGASDVRATLADRTGVFDDDTATHSVELQFDILT